MTEHDRLRLERKGAVAALDAIAALRTEDHTVAVDLAISLAEHEAQHVVRDYDFRLRQAPLFRRPEAEIRLWGGCSAAIRARFRSIASGSQRIVRSRGGLRALRTR